MLISQTSDSKGKEGGGGGSSNNYEYETANELFEIMAKNNQFVEKVTDETLTASDLVILYKNLDIGTKLLTEVKYSQTKPSNQYVENVIYNDEHHSDESDICDIYSTEDIRNIMMINKERIDLFSNTASFEKTLCQKLGNIAVNSSNLASTYDKYFLFKDPYIKEQLNGLMPSMTETDVLPSSLLDYICCKRLEDNYNFYMDNVIRYVQHTIEQLKRISNGDYLTDKAKEKWRQVDQDLHKNDTKQTALVNSVSIPLRVERKFRGMNSTWDDVIHSEVDIRSLSKMLEKKVIVEIPRLICGTYKLFSKRYNDNLIISCKKESRAINETLSRLDVVLKIKKSESGHVISKLDSIKILQISPQISIQDSIQTDAPSIMCEQNENADIEIPKVIEIDEVDVATSDITYEHSLLTNQSPETYDDSVIGVDTDASTTSFPFYRNHDRNDYFLSYPTITDSKSYSDEQTEANFRLLSLDELRYNMQRLKGNSPVPEETEILPKKTKSCTKVRIKSPYENSSHTVEEKKRKRLLEIRERREIKKKSLNENCKISKHKYAKGAVMAQASSSVTKLSITNKSFYNSIYGQVINNESINTKKERKIQNTDLKIVVELENCEEEIHKKSSRSSRNEDKYINHSYYLDDADTEVMHLEKKQKSGHYVEEACAASSSEVSEDSECSLSLLKDMISTSDPPGQSFRITQELQHDTIIQNEKKTKESSTQLESKKSMPNVVPANTPKESPHLLDSNKIKDLRPSVETRKSIDKIYDLMKKLGKIESPELKPRKSKLDGGSDERGDEIEGKQYNSSIQPSDSGTSLKHHLASSVPSCFSFEKSLLDPPPKKKVNKKSEIPISVATKVGIGPIKSQSSRLPEDKQKRDRKKISSPVTKISENPLKAISQLLREFENVQKSRHSTKNEMKSNKKQEADKKNSSRQVTFRKPLQLEHTTTKDSNPSSRVSTPKDKKYRVNMLAQTGRPYNAKPVIDEKQVEKFNRNKITDIIDQVKEARGEAVRGPPKSRLYNLAQPKRPYNQMHNEQFSNKNRNTVNRPQRSINRTKPVDRRDILNVKMRQRKGSEISGPQKPHSTVPPLGIRRSDSSSPVGNRKRSPVPATGPSYKPNVPEAPETLLKKMVAVESYVKNHYGRGSPTRELKDFSGAQKSRVPLIPTDLDIGSVTSSRTAEESTTLGKKLHNMIGTMISTTAPALSSLCEKNETSVSSDSINEAFIDTIEHYEEMISNTDFPIDVFGDKSITTAVAGLPSDNETVPSNNVDFNVITYDIQPFNSMTELARLENALYRRLSAGTFQKRLRIKNLTLTPKHSLQQVVVLQSGDVGSFVVKSTLSQKFIKQTTSKTNKENVSKPTQSHSHTDWAFAHFPTQISTVGYSVPNTARNVESEHIKPQEEIKLDLSGSKESQSNTFEAEFNKINQFIKESQQGQIQTEARNNPPQEKITDLNKLQKNEKMPKESEKPYTISIQSNFELENNTEIIDKSTSLDLLVGLLNEIKNITSCQTHLTENKSPDVNDGELKKLEFILKTAEFQENSVNQSPQDTPLLKSIENLEHQNSLCKMYIPNCNVLNNGTITNNNQLRVDKEVTVNFSATEHEHKLTDIPSQLFPITVHHSTNVTNSLIGIIREPSEQSMYYFTDYHTLYCNSSFNKIMELPRVESKQSSLVPVCIETENEVNENRLDFKNDIKCEAYQTVVSEFDPLLKVKRDILVTVYSILVMIVLSALSFPEFFYRL